MGFKQDLKKILEQHDLTLCCDTRRLDTPKGREFCARWTWASESSNKDCRWEGFETIDEMLDDMIDALLKKRKVR